MDPIVIRFDRERVAETDLKQRAFQVAEKYPPAVVALGVAIEAMLRDNKPVAAAEVYTTDGVVLHVETTVLREEDDE